MFIINILLTQIYVMNDKYIILVHNTHSMYNLDEVKFNTILKEYQQINTIYTRNKSEHVAVRRAGEVISLSFT